MLVSITSGEMLITLRKAAALLPSGRNGKKCHTATIWRWISKGAKAPDGSIVRLEGIKRPGGWMTSKEAIDRFFAELTSRVNDHLSPKPRTAIARRRSSEHAAEELARAGI